MGRVQCLQGAITAEMAQWDSAFKDGAAVFGRGFPLIEKDLEEKEDETKTEVFDFSSFLCLADELFPLSGSRGQFCSKGSG